MDRCTQPGPAGRRTSCGIGIAVVPSFSVGVAGVLGRRQPRPNGRTLLLPSFSGMAGLAGGEASPC